MDLRESKISQGEGIGRHPWEGARKEVVASLIKRFIPSFKSSNTTVLDIGCGDTWLIEQLSEDFPKAKFIAVDTAFDAELLLKYRSRLQGKPFEVFDSLETALSNRTEKVNLILLLDVIEHIEDDVNFLKWVLTFEQQIDKNTFVLITVPAYQSLFCSHDVFLGHYRRYTNSMLKDHINQAGLEVLHLGYFFSTLLPPRILAVILEKIFPSQTGAKGVGGWQKSVFDSVIKNTLIVDYKITAVIRSLGIKLPGLSNYVLCRKRV